MPDRVTTLLAVFPAAYSIEQNLMPKVEGFFFAAWDDPTSSYRCNRSRSRKLQNVLGAQGVLGVVLKGPQIKI